MYCTSFSCNVTVGTVTHNCDCLWIWAASTSSRALWFLCLSKIEVSPKSAERSFLRCSAMNHCQLAQLTMLLKKWKNWLWNSLLLPRECRKCYNWWTQIRIDCTCFFTFLLGWARHFNLGRRSLSFVLQACVYIQSAKLLNASWTQSRQNEK